MKYEDLKCEFCDGHGEREINVDGADCPQTCSFCDGTGIDQDQLMKLPKVVKMLEALKRISELNTQASIYDAREMAKVIKALKSSGLNKEEHGE